MKLCRFLLTFVFLVSASVAASAQSTSASLTGFADDPSKAVIPGVQITAINTQTGEKSSTLTNRSGQYVLPDLNPGTYRIEVDKQGFKGIVQAGVVLHVQDVLQINFHMAIGSASETVTVNAGTNTINTTSATVSTVINRQFIENLPLNGRSFQTLIELTPGVVPGVSSLGSQGQFNVNGQRANSNYYSIDGVSANFGGASESTLVTAGGSLPALTAQGGTNSLVSVDAMQEFRIQTSTFAPEFGRTPGAQIAIETRSGTNKFNGNVFDYFRNDAMDANNWFNNNLGLRKPGDHVNDFGGILGGPLYRDKIFFFFSYEGLRLTLPQTTETEVPGLDARAAAPPALQPILSTFPIPNGPELTDGSMLAPFNASYSNPSTLNAWSIRIDDSIGSKWRVFGRYSDAPSNNISRGNASFSLNTTAHTDTDVRSLTAGATWLMNNRMTNDLRFNYGFSKDHLYLALDKFGGGTPPPSSALFSPSVPYNTGNAEFLFLVALGTDTAFGIGSNTNNSQTQYNVIDNFSVEQEKHELKFGVDYRQLTSYFGPVPYANVPIFLNIPTTVANLPLYTEVGAQRAGDVFIHNLGLYAQDTWRTTPRLTLTYGLREDIDFTPTAGNGLNLLAVTGFGGNGSSLGIAPPGTPVYKTVSGIAPRVGFNYQLNQTSGHQTVLRGGWGIFYDLVSQDIGKAIYGQVYPFGAVKFVYGPLFGGTATFPLTPAEAQPPAITLTPPLSQARIFNPNLKLPYSYEYNVAVEQALGSSQSFSISYVGAIGRRLLQESYGANLNRDFAFVTATDNTSTSDYNALQVQFKRQVTQGLQALAAYTWSHSIDTASTDYGSGNNDLIILGENANVNRGPSDFDFRNAGSVGLSYAMPKLEGNFLRRNVLGGWSVDTLVLAYSAPPVTVIDGNLVFPAQVSVRPDVVPGVPFYLHGNRYPGGKAINPAAFKDPPFSIVNGTPVPLRQGTLGRNSLRGFGAKQWDFSLHRDFMLPKTLDLQFRAELFNIVNYPNFGGVNANFTTPLRPTFGQATETLAQSLGGGGSAGGFNPLFQIGGPRSIQLALKLMF